MRQRSGIGLRAVVLVVSAAWSVGAWAGGMKGPPEPTLPARHTHTLRLAPLYQPRMQSRPQVQPVGAPVKSRSTVPSLAPDGFQSSSSAVTVEAKVLIISADGTESDLPAIKQAFELVGMPYKVWIAAQDPQPLTLDRLANGTYAFYSGVVLTTGSLAYDSGTGWVSALSSEEWQNLWNFEAMFGVRQVTWYTYPTPDYGFGWATAVDTSVTPVPLRLTAEGQAVFPYLNPTGDGLAVKLAYTYLAQFKSPTGSVLMTDDRGNALVAVNQYPDGRENLALTFDNAPWLQHSVALGYGIVNWVTRGLFLGDRRVYVSAQVDDLYLPNEMWLGGELRITGTDLQRVVDWQVERYGDPITAQYKTDMAYNGDGSRPGFFPGDTLVAASVALRDHFKWISHTYTHPYLDNTSYTTTYNELMNNNKTGSMLVLPGYSVRSLVTPNVSGLYNPNAMRAARDTGVRYVVSDTSRAGEDNPFPNVGIYNALEPSILEIPRRPTNLFYNVATPAEWASEYNFIYHDYWGRDLTPAEILDKTSDMLLMYLLKGENDPWMFHQPNLKAYDGTHFLLGDLLDATLAKYRAIYNLPWLSPTMDDLGEIVHDRTQYIAAEVTATISGGVLTLNAKRDAVVPVTGLYTPGASYYGGQYTSYIPVTAGKPVTVLLGGSTLK